MLEIDQKIICKKRLINSGYCDLTTAYQSVHVNSKKYHLFLTESG